MNKKLWIVGWLSLLLPAASACGALFPLDGYSDGAADSGADGSTAPSPSADGSAAECGTKPPPRVPSTAADTSAVAVFALDALDAADPATTAKGYDLDAKCTTDDKTSACKPPDRREVIRDLAGGVDNAGFPIFALASLRPRTPIAQGAYGVLVVVKKWNGTPDDPNVEVQVFNSPGTKAPLKKDGTDTLPIVDELSGTSGVAAFRADDSQAYVAGGTLVANLQPESLSKGPAFDVFNFGQTAIALDTVRVPFYRVVLTARIEGTGATQRLADGVLAGIVYPDELMTSLALVPDPSGSGDAGTAYLCDGTAKFREAQDKICSRVDTIDPDAPSDVCDHTSVVLTFTAVAAKAGAVVAPTYVSGCPRDGDSLPQVFCP